MGLPVQLYKAAVRGANTQISGAAIDGVVSKRTFSVSVANATAGTAVTESLVEHIRRGGIVRSISLTAPIAVTLDPTNNAAITVSKRTGAGAPAVIATISTIAAGTGSLVAFVPFAIPAAAFTAANTVVADGDVITFAIAKGGTGVALTAATSFFTISVDLEED